MEPSMNHTTHDIHAMSVSTHAATPGRREG